MSETIGLDVIKRIMERHGPELAARIWHDLEQRRARLGAQRLKRPRRRS